MYKSIPGPITFEENGYTTVVGSVGYGVIEENANKTAAVCLGDTVYARVSSFLDFFKEVGVWTNELGTTMYKLNTCTSEHYNVETDQEQDTDQDQEQDTEA